MDTLTYAFTGHRPNKLGGYSDEVAGKLSALASRWLEEQMDGRKLTVISGMALGWDQAVARAASVLGIPWIAAVPFIGQEGGWPGSSRRQYHHLIGKASRIQVVCPGGYSPAKMHKRNAWMVDNSDLLVALWDGSQGGTANCVNYALANRRQVVNLWDRWAKR